MTYASDELSVHDGQPVELYRFRLRDTGTYWYFTTAAYNITYGGDIYVATPGLSRETIDESDDFLKTDLKIKFPSNHAFSTLFMLYTPDGIIDATVFRGHGSNFVQYWDGIIKTTYPIESSENASIICGPHTDAAQAPFLIRTYERLCDVPLYGAACGLDPEVYRVPCGIASVSGITITSSVLASYDDGWFNGGYVIANNLKRKIKTHVTTTLTLVSVLPGLTAGMPANIYPGCDHLRATCIAKFDNLQEYRGCDWIPNEEPFTQGVYK